MALICFGVGSEVRTELQSENLDRLTVAAAVIEVLMLYPLDRVRCPLPVKLVLEIKL